MQEDLRILFLILSRLMLGCIMFGGLIGICGLIYFLMFLR